ncbi:hypothetical protein IL54_3427 [Sphingobium sp. ba1]|nr:hypothetical protein IL54_3427 [Sphingobium sp. ba1]
MVHRSSLLHYPVTRLASWLSLSALARCSIYLCAKDTILARDDWSG